MPNEYCTRPAATADCPEIHAMICELAEFEKLSHEVTSTADDLCEALFGTHPAAECLVVENSTDSESPKLIGFALFFFNYSTFTGKRGLYLEDIYIRPSFRGKGLGKKLINSVIDCAEERNCPRVDWAVLEWNQKAIDFYQSLGADVMSDWRITRIKTS